MKTWEYKLNVSGFYYDDDLTIDQKGLKMAEAIEKFLEKNKKDFEDDTDLENIGVCFESIDDVEEFDEGMVDLYDWADWNSTWIVTK